MSKKGVLLINIGTPDYCDKKSVYRYLSEFLNDPRVIDLPAIIRWPLINLCIVPLRYKKTTEAYQKIMTGRESPLLTYSNEFKSALAQTLGVKYQVELAMRYGQPNIQSTLKKFSNVDELIVLPLFPQYSSAATGSAIEETMKHLAKQWNIPTLHIINHFYNEHHYINAYSEIIHDHIAHKNIDLLLFSYHGLPERHITKSACKAICDKQTACPTPTDNNLFCYRAQCYETSRLIAKALSLSNSQYEVSFQSRLGKTPWIKPYTDLLLPRLIQKGIKNIALAFPSFVADCLETLEEANIRLRAQWQQLGGHEFVFIPCLNNHPTWIKAAATIIQNSHGND
jgi:ferrochelatase